MPKPTRDIRAAHSRKKLTRLHLAAIIAAVLGIGIALWSVFPPHPADAARAVFATATPASIPEGVEVPEGMIYVPGGVTHIGSEQGSADEEPVFPAKVKPFLMDRHPVTVAQFRSFVEATEYVTEAERFGDAGVFDTHTRQWRLIPGAAWHHPFGPDAAPAPDDHPVTQVSWNDAQAYSRWAGTRLPTEIEWEHAARGGRDRNTLYAWGDELEENGHYHANTWQGFFPLHDSGADGHQGTTSPVGAFGETELGLTDMGGNVWEWTADWYRPYSDRGTAFTPTAQSEKAQRGGSYLCSPHYCHGYRVSGRSHSTPETSLAHVGFRTVRDLPAD